MKKRVLIVHMSLYHGGAERSLINFLRMLPPDLFSVDLLLFRKEGHYLLDLPPYVRLLTPSEPLRNLFYNSNSQLSRSAGVKGACYRLARLAGTGAGRLMAGKSGNREKQYRWRYVYKKLIPAIPEHYDVAMAYSHGEVTYFVGDKVSADRKLAWVHNDYGKTGLNRDFDSRYFRSFDSVASISAGCVQTLRDTFPEVADKFVLLPNLLSEEEVRRQSRESDPDDIDPGVPCVLTIGRLSDQKQPLLSVEAAKLLKAAGVRFCWYWIGTGDLQPAVEEAIFQAGVGDYFKLLGLRKNPYPYIRVCQVFVQNSAYEGKSMVLDEVKILCRPIVATRYPTVGDQLLPDEAVVTGMEARDVAQGIRSLLEDPGKAQALSDTLAQRHYGNEQEISRYVQWIDEK